MSDYACPKCGHRLKIEINRHGPYPSGGKDYRCPKCKSLWYLSESYLSFIERTGKVKR